MVVSSKISKFGLSLGKAKLRTTFFPLICQIMLIKSVKNSCKIYSPKISPHYELVGTGLLKFQDLYSRTIAIIRYNDG